MKVFKRRNIFLGCAAVITLEVTYTSATSHDSLLFIERVRTKPHHKVYVLLLPLSSLTLFLSYQRVLRRHSFYSTFLLYHHYYYYNLRAINVEVFSALFFALIMNENDYNYDDAQGKVLRRLSPWLFHLTTTTTYIYMYYYACSSRFSTSS